MIVDVVLALCVVALGVRVWLSGRDVQRMGDTIAAHHGRLRVLEDAGLTVLAARERQRKLAAMHIDRGRA